MRRSTLLFSLVFLGCEADPDVYAVVEGFLDGARPAECVEVTPYEDVAVTEIRTATDSTWLLLDEPQRRITELDHRLRPLWSVEYASAGPASAFRALSAGRLGDTAVALVDRGGLRVLVLARDGAPLWSSPLGFMPHSLATTAAGEVLVTPIRIGDEPRTLLVRFAPGRREEIEVPPRHYEDIVIRAMGNMVLAETLPDGRIVVLHQYLSPRGFTVDVDGTVARVPVPTPDGTLGQLDFIPAVPLTEADQPRIASPALGLSVDRSTSEVYVLTRSGRTVDGVQHRAILRLDDRLRFLEGYTVDRAAAHMAVLPRARIAIVADPEDRIYSCKLPVGGARADAS